MRLILYYMTRTVKNQIRKLFRSWVAIFLVACIGIVVLFGLGAAALSSLFEKSEPEDGYFEELPEDGTEALPDEEYEGIALDEATVNAIIELAAGGIVLVVLVFSALMADKNASSIFLMADVNLLFPAPLRPQSVLLFRLIMQAGTSIIATVYLIFQIPNLILNFGLDALTTIVILGAWFLLMIYSKLVSVLFYTLAADHPSFKKRMRYGLYILLLLLACGFFLFSRSYGTDYLGAAPAFFNAPISRCIPVWGWLKALVMYALERNLLGVCLSLAALLLGATVMILLIRRTKADFYEEAMAHSEETAAALAAQKEKSALTKRKKDRSDRLERDGFHKGSGATVYFHKAMYNRFRFAHLKVFTKTSETYLVISLGVTAFQVLVTRSSFFPAVPLCLAALAFFRSLGNPISQDLAQESFFLVPDTAHRKVLFSFLGGIVNSALDLLPAFLISAVLLRANPAEELIWLLLILSMGAYSDSAGLFIDLSLSTGLTQMIKSLIQILFIYFGLAPAAVLIVLGFAFDKLILFALLAILLNVGIAALSLAVSPLFMERGRR